MKKPVSRSDQEQATKLAELGDRLQQSRQAQGLTLEQVAIKTMIPVRLLSAIETADLEQLPEPVYVQGFIRRYADAIGLNGVLVASEFFADAIGPTARPLWRFNVQAQLRPLHLYLLYTVVVVSAVSGLSYLLNRSTGQMVGLLNVPPPSAAPQSVGIGPIAKPAAPSSPQASPVPPAGTVQVSVKLTEQSWLQVVADGKTVFEEVLPETSQRTWVASKQLTVRAGNAGGVLISFNNSKEKPLGKPGSVEEVTFGSGAQAARFPLSADPTLTASSPRSF